MSHTTANTLPNRQSIRLDGYDYTQRGVYFITICADQRKNLFGHVDDGTVAVTAFGQVLQDCWLDLPNHHRQIQLDAFVLMPNHIHFLIWLNTAAETPALPSSAFLQTSVGRPRGPSAGSVASIVGGFKSAVSRKINQMRGVQRATVWQRDYFEHIVRNEESLHAIREYIRTNPVRWAEDLENPQGTGKDDVEKWVRSLVEPKPPAALPVGATPDFGEFSRVASPAVRNEKRGRQFQPLNVPDRYRVPGIRATQASPLRDQPPARTQSQDEARATQASPLRDQPPARTQAQEQARATQASPLRIPFRIGHGYDLHRLQLGGKLMLGGVEVATGLSPVAHSDGDVVLHALVDALLGATGWGDIGEHFPNTDDRWKDAPSRVFVDEIYAKVRTSGYVVGNLDVTILAERPKVKAFKKPMAELLSQFLSVDVSQINVKAGTNEECDAIGRGEAIAAHAVVLLMAIPTDSA